MNSLNRYNFVARHKYAANDPVGKFDRTGLDTYLCHKVTHYVPDPNGQPLEGHPGLWREDWSFEECELQAQAASFDFEPPGPMGGGGGGDPPMPPAPPLCDVDPQYCLENLTDTWSDFQQDPWCHDYVEQWNHEECWKCWDLQGNPLPHGFSCPLHDMQCQFCGGGKDCDYLIEKISEKGCFGACDWGDDCQSY